MIDFRLYYSFLPLILIYFITYNVLKLPLWNESILFHSFRISQWIYQFSRYFRNSGALVLIFVKAFLFLVFISGNWNWVSLRYHSLFFKSWLPPKCLLLFWVCICSPLIKDTLFYFKSCPLCFNLLFEFVFLF